MMLDRDLLDLLLWFRKEFHVLVELEIALCLWGSAAKLF